MSATACGQTTGENKPRNIPSFFDPASEVNFRLGKSYENIHVPIFEDSAWDLHEIVTEILLKVCPLSSNFNKDKLSQNTL